MKKILSLDKKIYSLWENFVNENKNSKFYHSLRFKDSIENTYKNCYPKYYLLFDEKVKAIFPFFLVKSKLFGNRLISLPFIDNGGFLGSYNTEDIKELLEELKKLNDIDYIEIRMNTFMENFEKDKGIFLDLGFHKNDVKNQIILELKNEEDLWNGFIRITKKGIKKAKKSNLDIRDIDNEKELKEFYKLYTKNMKRFGVPQHSYKYFLNFFIFLKNNFKGLNCYKNGKIISSLIVLFLKNHIYAAYNPSDSKHLIYQPNDIMHWEIIKWASKNKFNYFDIGQCDANAKEGSKAEGIYKFKKKWSGKVYNKYYFFYYLNKKNSEIPKKDNLKKLKNIWKKLPSPIIKILGPKIASQLAL